MTEGAIIFALAMTLLVMGALWLSAFLTKRAMHQVIGTFCRNSALTFREAKTVDELGLTPPDFLQRMTHFRDYKPHALRFLIDRGIVNVTREGKLYLMDGRLNPDLRCRGNGLWVLPGERS